MTDTTTTSTGLAFLTDASLELFIKLYKAAPNWMSEPIIDLRIVERGNLTDLKKKNLLITIGEDGDMWCLFTRKGVDLGEAIFPDTIGSVEAHA